MANGLGAGKKLIVQAQDHLRSPIKHTHFRPPNGKKKELEQKTHQKPIKIGREINRRISSAIVWEFGADSMRKLLNVSSR